MTSQKYNEYRELFKKGRYGEAARLAEIENKVSEILEDFRLYDGIYKREQIDAALELKTEIAPHLIEILQKLLSNPGEYIENEKRNENRPKLRRKKTS